MSQIINPNTDFSWYIFLNPVPQAGRLLVDRIRPSPLCTPCHRIFPISTVDFLAGLKYTLLVVSFSWQINFTTKQDIPLLLVVECPVFYWDLCNSPFSFAQKCPEIKGFQPLASSSRKSRWPVFLPFSGCKPCTFTRLLRLPCKFTRLESGNVYLYTIDGGAV